jgi:hypothetical protein
VFCLGTYTGAVSDAELRAITVDYTIEFARVLRLSSPDAAFSFLSGNGADPTGRSRLVFARYKGEAEKALLATGFPRVYIFRPAYIYPGEPRKTTWPEPWSMSLSEEHQSAEPWFSRTVTSGRWLSPFIPSEWEVSAATSQLWHNERCEKGIFILAPMVARNAAKKRKPQPRTPRGTAASPGFMDSRVSTCSTVWSQNISSHQQ